MRVTLPAVLIVLLACGPDAASEDVPNWTVEEDLRIGSLDVAETSLTMVTNIETSPAGDIYIAQPMDRQIRVFTADGAGRGVIGRPGEGPGEFGSISTLGWRGDTLFVADGQSQRISFFAADGRFLSDLTWLNVQTPRDDLLPSVPGILLDDGTAILRFGSYADAVASGDVKSWPWALVDRAGALLDTVWDAPVGGNDLVLQFGTTITMFTVQPWTTDPIFLPAPDGDPLYAVDPLPAGGAQGTFAVTRITQHGDTIWARRLPFVAVPITDVRADSARDQVVANLESFRSRRGMALSELRSTVEGAVRLPAVVPPVRRGLVATDGSLWLERQDRSNTWTVIGEDGQTRAEVSVPAGLRLLHVAGTAVYGTITDDLDVPYVVRLRIHEEGT